MFNLHYRTLTIGLDLGEDSVRAVQIARSSEDHPLYRAARFDRRGFSEDGRKETRAAGDAIRQCLQLADFKGNHVSTALNPPDIELHALELPAVVLTPRSDDLRRAVQCEVERLATATHPDLETRHWPLPDTKASAPNIIAVAAPRERILEAVTAFDGVGLACTRVDAAAAALCRFACRLNSWDSETVWGILDLGYRQTRLVLCVDEVPVLIRAAGSGGGAWTQHIADALQISVKAAEVQKRDVGIALTGRGVRADSASALPNELGSILTGILRRDLHDIAGEVKRSYEYVLSCYPGRRAADLVLVGGGAATRNLPEYLTNALGIGVHPASTYLEHDSCRWHLSLDNQNQLEDFALAIGLSLAG